MHVFSDVIHSFGLNLRVLMNPLKLCIKHVAHKPCPNYMHVYNIIWPLGLGKASQGISTALSVEKTSKRGGKIVNIAAEQGKIYRYIICISCLIFLILKIFV